MSSNLEHAVNEAIDYVIKQKDSRTAEHVVDDTSTFHDQAYALMTHLENDNLKDNNHYRKQERTEIIENLRTALANEPNA